MASKRVTYGARRSVLHVEGTGDVFAVAADHFHGALEILAPARLLSIRSALRAMLRCTKPDLAPSDIGGAVFAVYITWSDDSATVRNADATMPAESRLGISRQGDLLLGVSISHQPVKGLDSPGPELLDLIAGWCSGRGLDLVGFRKSSQDEEAACDSLTPRLSETPMSEAVIALGLTGKTVAWAHGISQQLIAISGVAPDGILGLRQIHQLLISGSVSSLIGLPRSQILDVRPPPSRDDNDVLLEIGKDVASIANSSTGGILVFGMSTTKGPFGDLIAKIDPLLADDCVRIILKAINQFVVPPINLLEVAAAPVGDGGEVVYVYIPPQPMELVPFVVAGRITAGLARGQFVSIPPGRGAGIDQMSTAAILAAVSAGFRSVRDSKV